MNLDDLGAADGAALLDELHAVVTTYVVLPSPEAADAVVLWIAASHAVEGWAHATRLVIRSPEKRCGKSRLLDVIAGTCRRPLVTVNATVAAVFRSIGDDAPPTLLVDEADTLFGSKKAAENNEDLRGLLNAGHQRGRPALRCVGPNQTPTEFPTFAMAALAGIGSMPDTVEDRAVVLTMRRRAPGEAVRPFRARRDGPVLAAMRDKLAGWIAATIDELTAAEPDLPVEDRAADTWEPLVAVADAAGGTWPARARRACLVLTTEHEADAADASLGLRLLTDCRDVLLPDEHVTSTELVRRLRAVDEAPWSAFELDVRGLARRLSGYGIKPDRIRVPGDAGTRQVRGYRTAQFADAWNRYLTPAGGDVTTVTPSHREGTDNPHPSHVTDTTVTPTPDRHASPSQRDGVTLATDHPPVEEDPWDWPAGSIGEVVNQ